MEFLAHSVNKCFVNGANNLKHILAQLEKGSALFCWLNDRRWWFAINDMFSALMIVIMNAWQHHYRLYFRSALKMMMKIYHFWVNSEKRFFNDDIILFKFVSITKREFDLRHILSFNKNVAKQRNLKEIF